ncbi:hypothetical protein M2322_004532 [Rhodoblastus acidophilus]|uniref:hypothetical protein n=1 Tax=Rhodoblastus acidophilus TaxID=1074 RepID=UPI002224EBF6|nr:hypothetical protein [Rhodoblastus acidophilus]MCW2318963.1 hypothetical protein [Rhodoblastus acidophilus]
MKLLIAGSVVALSLATPALALPAVATAPSAHSDQNIVQARGDRFGDGGHGRHEGWGRGRHYGWGNNHRRHHRF